MSKMSQIERTIQLENDIILPVFGQFDSNIRKIEKSCGVQIVNRGDDVKVVGEERGVHKAWNVLNSMAALAAEGKKSQNRIWNTSFLPPKKRICRSWKRFMTT